MDIAYQFFEIGILLANNGFIAILKKLAVPLVPTIEGDSVAGKKATHHGRKWGGSGLKKEMCVVR